ncbi:MAG: sodium ion-translocating decarboxylase subunit beta [Deltaproteobacteria bacterium]
MFLGIQTGIASISIGNVVMLLIGLGFIYLAIRKEWEPYELLPIGAGMILANFPITGLMTEPVPDQAMGMAGIRYSG